MAGPSVTYTFANSTAADASQVNTNFTDLINGATDGTKDYSISALTCAGAATFNGNVTLGNASSDDITVTGSLASSIPIKTTFSYDIGSSTLGLRDSYFGSADGAAYTVKLRAPTVAASKTITLPSTTGTLGLYADPTVQKFTSGSGTYTTPTGVKWIRVRMVGGGGGGGGSGTSDGTAATAGGNTTFGTSLLEANGGSLGARNAGGAGGTASLGSGPLGLAFSGAAGSGGPEQGTGPTSIVSPFMTGGVGGSSFFGGAGASAAGAAGAAATNSGSGGGGGGAAQANYGKGGGGGGAGGFVDAIITSPSASYSYAVGAAGTAGGAGGSGYAGGAGAAGIILVEEFYG